MPIFVPGRRGGGKKGLQLKITIYFVVIWQFLVRVALLCPYFRFQIVISKEKRNGYLFHNLLSLLGGFPCSIASTNSEKSSFLGSICEKNFFEFRFKYVKLFVDKILRNSVENFWDFWVKIDQKMPFFLYFPMFSIQN